MATEETAGTLLDADHDVVAGDAGPTCSLCGYGKAQVGSSWVHHPAAGDVDGVPGWIESYGGGRFG